MFHWVPADMPNECVDGLIRIPVVGVDNDLGIKLFHGRVDSAPINPSAKLPIGAGTEVLAPLAHKRKQVGQRKTPSVGCDVESPVLFKCTHQARIPICDLLKEIDYRLFPRRHLICPVNSLNVRAAQMGRDKTR